MKRVATLKNSSFKRGDPAKLRRGDPAELSRGERGQSLVELALSLTIILLLLAGAVDFSMAYFSFSAMQDAAQEGALYGSVNPDDETGIITRVRSASSNPVNFADTTLVDVIVTLSADPACEGDEVKVNVIYDYPISMPFIGAIIGSQKITLNASVTDTILQPVCP
jgi:Flp pilus assembly protein TadG